MHRIFPPDRAGDVDGAELERIYTFPADRRRVVVNFVGSADGAVEIDGRSAGLSTPPDRRVFRLGSDLADVVLLGAGTAVGEGFNGVHPDERTAEIRRRHGLSPVPPIAVVSAALDRLAPDSPLFTEALVPTIVITSEAAPRAHRKRLAEAGADLLIAGDEAVDLAAAVDALDRRGLRRIDCEGGPLLFGSLLAAGLVDELRLTVAPMLVSGSAGRIATGPRLDPARLELASVLVEDGTLLMRYLVRT